MSSGYPGCSFAPVYPEARLPGPGRARAVHAADVLQRGPRPSLAGLRLRQGGPRGAAAAPGPVWTVRIRAPASPSLLTGVPGLEGGRQVSETLETFLPEVAAKFPEVLMTS